MPELWLLRHRLQRLHMQLSRSFHLSLVTGPLAGRGRGHKYSPLSVRGRPIHSLLSPAGGAGLGRGDCLSSPYRPLSSPPSRERRYQDACPKDVKTDYRPQDRYLSDPSIYNGPRRLLPVAVSAFGSRGRPFAMLRFEEAGAALKGSWLSQWLGTRLV